MQDGALSNADFEIASRAVALGWLTEARVEEAVRAHDRERSARLLDLLPLSAEQIASLRSLPRRTEVPIEAAVAMRDPARRIGSSYWVLEEIQRSMGIVYRAWDQRLERVVALKLPRFDSLDEATRAQFAREGQLAAKLEHPHIAKIYEVGEHHGSPFLAIQFIDGKNLSLARVGARLEDLVRWARDLVSAVAYAHSKGVIHRDLKPGNAMVDGSGHVYLLDFGLAREWLSGASNRTAHVAGTASYMAPEQALGKVSPSSDIYGLGATLYDLATGRPPFLGDTGAQVLAQVLEAHPPWPSVLNPSIPRDLEAIVIHCLEKDPGRRYLSAFELREDLDAYLSRSPLVHARRPTTAYVLARSLRKHPLPWVLGTLAAASLVGGTTFGVLTLQGRARALEDRARSDERALRSERAHAREATITLAEGRLARAFDLEADPSSRVQDLLLSAADVRSLTESAVPRGPGGPASLPGIAADADLDPGLLRRIQDLRRSSETLALLALGRVASSRGPSVVFPQIQASSVAFAPDGCQVAAALGHVVVVWDVKTGKPLHVLLGHTGPVSACAFSPDGKQVLSASEDGTLRLWDRQDGRLSRVLSRDSSPILSCAFSPEGTCILAGSRDGVLSLFDRSSGELVLSGPAHTGPVLACSCAPSGTTLLSASLDGTLSLTDRATGRPLWTVAGKDPVGACVFSLDGMRLLSAPANGPLELRDGASGELLRSFASHGSVQACAFSPSGDALLSASRDGTIELWNASSGELLHTTAERGETLVSCAFSPDGRSVLSASLDGAIRLRDVATGRVLRSAAGSKAAPIACGSFSPGGGELLIASADGSLRLIERSGKLLRKLVGHSAGTLACAFSADGKLAVSASSDRTLRLWDLASGACRATFLGHEDQVTGCAFSPEGQEVLSSSWDGTLGLWTLSGTLERRLLGHVGRVRACAFSPSGKLLASGGEDGTLRIWDRASGETVRTMVAPSREGYALPVLACSFSRDGKKVLSLAADHMARLWDPSNGELLAVLGQPEWKATACGFSPSGTEVLLASRDGMLRILNASRGDLERHLEAQGTITTCGFSPDGREIFAGTREGTLALLEAPEAQLLSTLGGHSAFVATCAFSPDGRLLVTGSGPDEGMIRLHDLSSSGPVAPDRVLPPFAGSVGIECSTFSARGDRLLVGSDGGSVGLFSFSSGKWTRLSGHSAAVLGCVFSPDERRALSWSGDRTARVWDLETGEAQLVFDAGAAGFSSCAFTPRGDEIVALQGDGALRFLDSRTGAEVRSLERTAPGRAWSLSPDGESLLMGGVDGSLVLRDASTGALSRTYPQAPEAISSCAFTADGHAVLSACSDGTIRLMDRTSGRVIGSFRDSQPYTLGCAFSPDGRIFALGCNDRLVRVYSVPVPLLEPDWLAGFGEDPRGKVARALLDIRFHGWPRDPGLDDVPSLVGPGE